MMFSRDKMKRKKKGLERNKALVVIYFNTFYWFCCGHSVSEPYEDLKKQE